MTLNAAFTQGAPTLLAGMLAGKLRVPLSLGVAQLVDVGEISLAAADSTGAACLPLAWVLAFHGTRPPAHGALAGQAVVGADTVVRKR